MSKILSFQCVPIQKITKGIIFPLGNFSLIPSLQNSNFFHIYSASQFRLATCQVFNSHMCLAATMVNDTDLECAFNV